MESKFSKVLLVHNNRKTSKHEKCIENIKKIISGINFEIIDVDNINKNHFDNVDLVITAGGDGTFIKAASFLNDTLIIGINSEPELSEGFLTSIHENEMHYLKEMISGKYKIIERERAEVKINGNKIIDLALNDVYVGSKLQFHTSRYIIELKDTKEEQRSSGVLVSTGSGSTAWYESAGGKPFHYTDKKLKFLVREPYTQRIFRPEILTGEINEKEKINFESKRYDGGIISVDSFKMYDFNLGDKAEIKMSNKPLKVIIPIK